MPVTRLAIALLLFAGSLQAAPPRDALLRYVPDDAGFCLVFTDLPGTVTRLRESPFAAAVSRVLNKEANGIKELEELRKAAGLLQQVLQLDWAELPDVVFGEAFVFVYRPGPPGKPELEEGLFLLRSKDGKRLAELIKRINTFQGVKIEDAEHKGVRYVRRVEKSSESFYLLVGPVMLLSSQETMIKRAIERELSLPRDAVPPLVKRLEQLGLSDAPLSLVVAPRAFDALVASGKGKTAESLAAYWKALDGVGLGLHLKRDAVLSVSLIGRPAALPAAGRALALAEGKAAALWAAMPEEPLLALAGTVDLNKLYAVLSDFMPDDKRLAFEKDLDRWVGSVAEKDVLKDLFPALGPDWGACLMAPPADSKEPFPRVLVALKLQGDEDVEGAILRVVESWATMLVLSHNSTASTREGLARTVTQGKGKTRLRFIDFGKSAPPGVRPSWAVRAGHLLLASSPSAIESFKPGATRPRSEGTLLARASTVAWKKFFREQRGAISAHMVDKEGVTLKESHARLDALDDWLGLVQAVELRQIQSKERLTFQLRLQLAEPLRKSR